MKKKILFLILVLLTGQIQGFVGAAPVELNASEENGLAELYGQRTVWSNYTNAFYVFTHFGYTVVQGANTYNITGYAASKDGINWVYDVDWMSGGVERTADCTIPNYYDFDVTLDSTGRYLWVCWKDEQGAQDDVYLRKAELHANLSISWVEDAQQVYNGVVDGRDVIGYIDIEVDSSERPFVATCSLSAGSYFAFTRWSELTNGTWRTDGEALFDLFMPGGKVDTGIEYSILSRLANGKMAWTATWIDAGGGNLWAAETIYFNGVNWIANSGERLYTSLAAETQNYMKVDVTSYGDNLVGAYVYRQAGFQRLFIEEATYDQPWVNKTGIKEDYPELVGLFSPSLSVDDDGNVFLFVLRAASDSVNYTWRYSNYTWNVPLESLYDNNSQTFTWFAFSSPNNFWNYCPVVFADDVGVFHDVWFDYLAWDNESIPVMYQHYNTTLYNQDGTVNDGWIFEGEVYDLISYVDNVTACYVNTTDSRHDIRFNWNNATEQMWISVDPDDQFTIGLAHSEYERTGNVTRLLWRFIPDRSIIDCVNQSWAYYIENDFYNISSTGSLGFDTHIYNLGGFTYYNFQGDGGRITGGHPWELYATNGTEGSSARAEQIYRKLQHIHFLVEIDMDNEWDAGAGEFDIDPGVGFVDIGIDYRLNGTWVEGFYVRLYVQSAEVGHDNAGTDENYVEWSVDWYNYDPGTGTHQNLRSGLIFSNHWGYDNENLDPDYHNRTSSQLWIDLWFDRTNASTAIAGQVNSMYYGLKEHGASWWPGYGDFQPMRGDYENAMFLDDLYDEGGNVTDSMKFDLMRVFVEVGKVADADGDDETWTIRAIENINRKLADDRMQGIEQPSFEETLVLEMPMFQSLNPIIRAIDGLSVAIWKGALGFQKILWGAMDSFFAWAGFGEGFFSRITTFLMTLPEIFIAFMEFMPTLFLEMAEIIQSVFAAIVLMIPLYTISLGTMIETIMDYWHILTQLLNGQLLPFDIIQDIQIGDWINAGITMLPTYEIFGIIFDDDPGRRAEQRINFYSKLFGGVLNFLKNMASFMAQMIQTIMDILPG
jgi:hypothetical protein